MGHYSAPRDGAGEAGGVGQVALGKLGIEARQIAPVAAWPHQQPQPVAAPRQAPRDGGADEAGGSGDKGNRLQGFNSGDGRRLYRRAGRFRVEPRRNQRMSSITKPPTRAASPPPAVTRRAPALRAITIVLGLAGVAVATALVAWFGLGRVADALGRVGWSGFGLYTAIQAGLFVPLAAAWYVLVRGRDGATSPWVLTWGRMVRDAAAQLLPFSAIGGFVLGARVVTLHGMPAALATASTIVDVTAEFAAQITFALIGLLVLAAKAPHSDLLLPAAGGIAVAVLAVAGFIATQRGAGSLFRALATRVGGERFGLATRRVDRVQAALEAIYAAPGRLVLGCVLHLLSWLGTAIGTWLAYRLMAMPIDLSTAIAIEALLHVALTIGFVVPGGVGVQEAAFAGIGGIFGLPAEASLAVSLLSRARDLVLGVPILLAWQAIEARRLAVAREGEGSA
jgi:putative membrane protein